MNVDRATDIYRERAEHLERPAKPAKLSHAKRLFRGRRTAEARQIWPLWRPRWRDCVAAMIATRAEIDRDLAPWDPNWANDSDHRAHPKPDLFNLVFYAVWSAIGDLKLPYPTVAAIHRKLDRARKRMRGPR